MENTIKVDIVSAEADIWSGVAKMLFAPAAMGEIGVAPRHAPLLTRLKAGEVRVQQESGEELYFYVSGGIIEVQPYLVTILADTASRAKDLDEAAALEAKQRAEAALADKSDAIDYAKAQAELIEAVARLQMIENLRKRAKR
ncbi:MAG: F0F1 ATP synthase subunit epsilon [Xanthomonadaceae bacterium]|nr:F0F1 ATP synthase subunit epsilon [Xanthomonadaceae bacterium]